MNKQYTVAACLAALLGVSAPTLYASDVLGFDTSATQTNFGFNNGVKVYAGGSLGHNSQDSGCDEIFFQGSCEDSSMSWKLYGGARFNPMFGAELAYVDLGSAKMDGSAGSENNASKNELSGYQLTAVGYMPLNSIPSLELMGKAGVMFWNRESEVIREGQPSASEDDGISPMIGLGAQYQLNQNIYLRSEWEHTFNTGADSKHETDTDNYSVGLTYSTL